MSEGSDVVVARLFAGRSLSCRLLDGGASSGFENTLGMLRVEGGVRVMEAPSSNDLKIEVEMLWTELADSRSRTRCFLTATVAGCKVWS